MVFFKKKIQKQKKKEKKVLTRGLQLTVFLERKKCLQQFTTLKAIDIRCLKKISFFNQKVDHFLQLTNLIDKIFLIRTFSVI